MRISPATRFTEHLESLGIPAHGVSGNDGDARIDFKDEATPQQRLAARAAARNFDWSEMEPKDPDEVQVDVSNLTQLQRQAILNRLIAEFLVEHPKLAERWGVVVTKKV